MNKEYKAHPLMLLSIMKPTLFLLVFPLIKAVFNYFTDRRLRNVILFELLLFIVILLLAFMRYRSFRVSVKNEKVIISYGLVFATRAEINISQLSSIQSRQNPLDAIFRCVTYIINTEAGRKNRSDFKFKLSIKDSKEISQKLYGNKESVRVRFSALKIAILAATTSSAFTGIIIGVPIINRAGNLLGIGLSQMLFDEINNVSNKFSLYFPPIVNVISLIFLMAYVVSFIYSFIKYIKFRLYISEDKLEVRSGFFVRTRISFRRKSINDVRIEQSPLMLLFRRYAMKVSVGGYGDSKSESEVIVPSAGRKQIKKDFEEYFPFLKPDGNTVKAPEDKITKSRFLFLPAVYLLIVIVLSVVSALIFENFGRLILFLSLIALIMVFYYAFLCLRISQLGKIRLGNTIYAYGIKGFRSCKLYCPKEKIGQIKISRFFNDFRFNTCKVRLTVRSESADRIRVKLLDYNQVREEIRKCYGIEV